MTNITQIEQELQALKLINEKLFVVQNWLQKYYNNPYASKVRRDLNELQVQRSTRQRVIENLKANMPSHGYEITEYEVTEKPIK